METKYYGYGVFVGYTYDDPITTPIIPKMFDTMSAAMNYVYKNVYLAQDETVTLLEVGCLVPANDDETYIVQDIICGMPDLTTFEVGFDSTFLVDLPVPGAKATTATKRKKFINRQLLKTKATDDSSLIQYKAHIVSLDENGKQHESTETFDKFEDCRDYFTDNYDFDPEKYVSYEVSSILKGKDKGVVCSFSPDRTMKFGDWEIKLQIID